MISVPNPLCEVHYVPRSHPLSLPCLPQDELKPVEEAAGDQALQPARPHSSSSPPPPSAAPPAMEAEEKPPAPEENGEAELEPMRNGAGHTSETESSDSGATPGDKEASTEAPPDLFQEGRRAVISLSFIRVFHFFTINSYNLCTV